MKPFMLRFLKRSIPVALFLGLFGLGMGYGLYYAMVGFASEEPEGVSQILWRAPLTLALVGVGVLFIGESMAAFVRHQKQKFQLGRLNGPVSSTAHIKIPPVPAVPAGR